MDSDLLKTIIEIPKDEEKQFDTLVKKYRSQYIPTSAELVVDVFLENPNLATHLKAGKATEVILEAREAVWQKFLICEAEFNTQVMKELSFKLQTPRSIIGRLADQYITTGHDANLREEITKICGEYSGRVYPYIYKLSLSNTQSRRSRSGSTFENIIYKVYDILDYSFDSQKKVGKNEFSRTGLGKLVDSILPSIEAFSERRDMVVVGTMKTSLRERWQEVSEEIQRTNVPKIYLLTVDEKISANKAQQMANHNMIVVAPDTIAESPKLAGMRNIISFENYLFEELPRYLNYWKN